MSGSMINPLRGLPCRNPAHGGPGAAPRWTSSVKDGLGTAYATASRVWFTLGHGILNEVYYPTIDRPQVRNLQLLVTDGETFLQAEGRDLQYSVEPISPDSLGYRVSSEDPEGRYRIEKEIIADPHLSCVLVQVRFLPRPDLERELKLFVLCAPHLREGGWHNNGRVVEVSGHKVMVGYRESVFMALGASIPFRRCSCGYVDVNDGWTDLEQDRRMDWEYDCALDGNIEFIGELDLSQSREFTIALALADCYQGAVTTLFESLGLPYQQHRRRFVEQWHRTDEDILPLYNACGDGGLLYHRSRSLLLAHEDKTYAGALIASLTIPWGESKGD